MLPFLSDQGPKMSYLPMNDRWHQNLGPRGAMSGHHGEAKLSGHDMADTDFGGWQLSVQHKYNFHAGILQKGDGKTVYLKYKPQVRR